MLNQLQLLKRPRRNRKSEAVRALVQETHLTSKDFIAPFFLTEGKNIRAPITSLPGQFHLSRDTLHQEIDELLNLGINSLIFFPLINPKYKDATGSYATSEENHLLKTIRTIKESYPELCLFADVALDPFTSHGHDGLLSNSGEVLNDVTLPILAQMSVLYAEAGVDVIAPSDMMDGRVKFIREALDENRHHSVSIMSYSAKYASSFYGPFRDALKSAPSKGNKKSYQMNPANSQEAILEALLDEEEGADFLMVKPASLYLDIIHKIKEATLLPVAAYHVSGEYAMLKAASQNKWLDFDQALYESLISIKRAGADIIISYGAKEIAQIIKNS
ncbi:MAG: Delta-aminolevulinic acid dehydratase [Chlamydiae bacterium]|nr:Delta-aminolevulinic acid dehydratase [Chlamydiota bacterium]